MRSFFAQWRRVGILKFDPAGSRTRWGGGRKLPLNFGTLNLKFLRTKIGFLTEDNEVDVEKDVSSLFLVRLHVIHASYRSCRDVGAVSSFTFVSSVIKDN